MSQDINTQMAAALAAQSGETVKDVTDRVNAKEQSKVSQLQALIKQAEQAKVAVGLSEPKAKAKTGQAVSGGKTKRSPRNRDIATRQIHVFTSESLKQKFISSNIMFDSKASEKQVELLVRSKKKPLEFMSASDMTCETVQTDVPFGNELELAKAELHDQLLATGYKMINNRPKVVAPVQDTSSESETPVDETSVTDVDASETQAS